MPSHVHEVLAEMFRDRPALVADLLTDPLGIPVPEFHTARLSAGDLTNVTPTELRADVVVTLNVGNNQCSPWLSRFSCASMRASATRGRRTWRPSTPDSHAR
jgi:hypothetical protein